MTPDDVRSDLRAPAPGSDPPALGAVLLLADGRTPTGGHAHSAGVEEAVTGGAVRDLEDLASFLRGRLWTAGLTAAAVAAAACRRAIHRPEDGQRRDLAAWHDLDAEADARIPSPAQRATSRRLGGHLLRTARAAWPAPLVGALADAFVPAPHHPLVLGAVAGVAGTSPGAAAAVAAHESVTGPAGAAVRLLSLDPGAVAAVLARLTPDVDAVARRAAESAQGPIHQLPAPAAPLSDMLAERHAARKGTLFAS